MNLPTVWNRWRSAAAPAIPSVEEAGGHMTSDQTSHRADYVGSDRWVVDFLPGRQLTREQARDAMRIAAAPDRVEVAQWASRLGLTATEARAFSTVGVVQ